MSADFIEKVRKVVKDAIVKFSIERINAPRELIELLGEIDSIMYGRKKQ